VTVLGGSATLGSTSDTSSGLTGVNAAGLALASGGAVTALGASRVTSLAQTGMEATDIGAVAALLAAIGIVLVFGSQNRSRRRRRVE
jgi:hypothetical protein